MTKKITMHNDGAHYGGPQTFIETARHCRRLHRPGRRAARASAPILHSSYVLNKEAKQIKDKNQRRGRPAAHAVTSACPQSRRARSTRFQSREPSIQRPSGELNTSNRNLALKQKAKLKCVVDGEKNNNAQ